MDTLILNAKYLLFTYVATVIIPEPEAIQTCSSTDTIKMIIVFL